MPPRPHNHPPRPHRPLTKPRVVRKGSRTVAMHLRLENSLRLLSDSDSRMLLGCILTHRPSRMHLPFRTPPSPSSQHRWITTNHCIIIQPRLLIPLLNFVYTITKLEVRLLPARHHQRPWHFFRHAIRREKILFPFRRYHHFGPLFPISYKSGLRLFLKVSFLFE